jgi:hypothetical protein
LRKELNKELLEKNNLKIIQFENLKIKWH